VGSWGRVELRERESWGSYMYRVRQKVTPFWYLSFLPLLDAWFAIFVYLHIIFIKYPISKPSVDSIQMDSPAGWCMESMVYYA